MVKSAKEHLQANKQAKKVILESDFAGIKKGKKLFVGTPQIIDAYIKKIPFGQTRTIERLRRELARRQQCDATCPVSTSIFIRISAQAAIDEINEGMEPSEVTPFWRLLTSKDKITKRLTIDPAWIDLQRDLEQTR